MQAVGGARSAGTNINRNNLLSLGNFCKENTQVAT